jgi:hypothetical protein
VVNSIRVHELCTKWPVSGKLDKSHVQILCSVDHMDRAKPRARLRRHEWLSSLGCSPPAGNCALIAFLPFQQGDSGLIISPFPAFPSFYICHLSSRWWSVAVLSSGLICCHPLNLAFDHGSFIQFLNLYWAPFSPSFHTQVHYPAWYRPYPSKSEKDITPTLSLPTVHPTWSFISY